MIDGLFNSSVKEISEFFNKMVTSNCTFSSILNKQNFEYGFLYKNVVKINIACWNMYKQMYSFSEDWVSLFTSNEISRMRGVEFFEKVKTLAFNSFFILNNSTMSELFSTKNNYGYIVSVLLLSNRIYVLISPSDLKGRVSSQGLVFFIDNKNTLDENLTRLSYQNSSDTVEYEKRKGIFLQVLKYILYLSLANNMVRVGEIEHCNSVRNKLNCPNEVLFDFTTITDGSVLEYSNVREVTESNIVYLLSKKSKYMLNSHSRRGHYHRYWVGSGVNRHLESRWVDAMIINKDKSPMKCVVHKVK